MISVVLRFQIAKHHHTDYDAAYLQLVEMLQRFPGSDTWYCEVNAPGQVPLRLDDAPAVLHRLRVRAELASVRTFSASLLNRPTGQRVPGLINLDYSPGVGTMTVVVNRPADVQPNPTGWIAGIMLAVLESELGTRYAFADVYDRLNGRFVNYHDACASYPGRHCLGWMAYVRRAVSAAELPQAALILPAPGGSIVVSVDGAFKLADKKHVRTANALEMRMYELGLLPVF
ncbi:Imm52 family immunity protein [Stenotrophomonas sp.]|uniref:Imm52 family immunity protein n=1 Tax=Stenotrophomonas sp. TaxID=69392 RepID=UPI0028968A51|nr:Imm52 family immunity protein [Stenotrophomonas sp.]